MTKEADAIIARYHRLIWRMAYRYARVFPRLRGSEEDLYQEGAIGLLRGAKHLEEARTSTIAGNIIMRNMRAYIRKTLKVPMDPAHRDFSNVIVRFSDFLESLSADDGEDADPHGFLDGIAVYQPDAGDLQRLAAVREAAKKLGPKTRRAVLNEDDPHRELRRKGLARLRHILGEDP